MVHFQVDMGSAMGGHMSGKLVAAWLDEFLRETPRHSICVALPLRVPHAP